MTALLIIIIIIVGLVLWIISAKNRIMREEQNIFTEFNNIKVVVDHRLKILKQHLM